MLTSTFPPSEHSLGIPAQKRRAWQTWWLWFLGVLGATGVVGLEVLRNNSGPSMLAWVLVIALGALVVYQPRFGIYLILGLSLAGDGELLYWYPFDKNLSSRESLLFLSDSISFSPLEIFIAITAASWLFRQLMQRKVVIRYGPLFWPAVAFVGFAAIALYRGIDRGGDMVIALWQSRAMFYIPALVLLTTNLITRREHVRTLLWAAMLGLIFESIFGVWVTATVLQFDVSQVNEIAEHSTSIHTNSLFVLLIATFLYRGLVVERSVLLASLPLLVISYLANQRRAAFITLIIAILFILVVLFWENRTAFWLTAPAIILFGIAYVAVFWNNDSVIGLPAQAVRTVIGTDVSAEDQSSNNYRILENVNTMYTIEQNPLWGTGFGKKFIMLRRLPDISFFIWYEYIIHNSLLAIWMNMGLGGFLSMLYMVGLSLMLGMRNFVRLPKDLMSAASLVAMLYIMMHFIFTYVDMAWGAENMVYVGVMMGVLNCVEQIVISQPHPPAKRWPWQPEPTPHPGLRAS